MIGMINASMTGWGSEGGTGVNWDEPDYKTEDEMADLLAISIEEFAEKYPHMIIWEVDNGE